MRLPCILVLFLGCGSPDQVQPEIKQLNEIPLNIRDKTEVDERTATVNDTLPEGWVDVKSLIPELVLDIRYATSDNFVGIQLYPCERCLLRKEVAEAIAVAFEALRADNLGLKLFDCYRPRSVQEALWRKVPDARYVTNPAKGSMHNRGAAVDLTLIDQNGHEIDMGTEYDFFGEKAYHTFTKLPAEVLTARRKLRDLMQEVGFKHIRTEWWHYSYQIKNYEVSDFRWPCPGQAL
ncbi:MAG: M15 family metallopeptidase [Saprospiraceae bacterium]|nr:M15 family metallopeptidase [Saprospiraceae bacterium]